MHAQHLSITTLFGHISTISSIRTKDLIESNSLLPCKASRLLFRNLEPLAPTTQMLQPLRKPVARHGKLTGFWSIGRKETPGLKFILVEDYLCFMAGNLTRRQHSLFLKKSLQKPVLHSWMREVLNLLNLPQVLGSTNLKQLGLERPMAPTEAPSMGETATATPVLGTPRFHYF